MNKGFTLIELLVVIGIIVLLTAITLPHYRAGEHQFALQRSAHKLASDIRMAQEMAMSARETRIMTPPRVPEGGYGIHFARYVAAGVVNYRIYLYADLNNNARYTAGERVKTIVLEKGVKVERVEVNGASSSEVDITFRPPDPTILISPGNKDKATIILSLKPDPTQTRTISVNTAGLIAIE